jgi:hypothetical protein
MLPITYPLIPEVKQTLVAIYSSFTKHLACRCNIGQRYRTNGCNGACTNAPYNETLDFNSDKKCEAYIYTSPSTSSDGSILETSSEGMS